MEYIQFTGKIAKLVTENLGEGEEVKIVQTVKNNGERRTGISIFCPGRTASPTIYLEEYYVQYKQGMSLKDVVAHLVQVYLKAEKENHWSVEDFEDFEKIKDRIVFKLINARMNEEILKDIPHTMYMDLAVIYYIIIEECEQGTISMTIHNNHIELWGKSFLQIQHYAQKNTPRILPEEYWTMDVILREIMQGGQEEQVEKEQKQMEEELPDFFVLSNKNKNQGAAVILYPGILETIYQKIGEDYTVIPSSIHEMIIVPQRLSPIKSELNDMIREINKNEVSPEDVLSDHAYYYAHDENCLTM